MNLGTIGRLTLAGGLCAAWLATSGMTVIAQQPKLSNDRQFRTVATL